MAKDELEREDLIRGINAVITKLRDAGEPAGIRIIGGAALAIRYFDRRTTSDVDAQLFPEGPILRAAAQVAIEQGWAEDWVEMNRILRPYCLSVASVVLTRLKSLWISTT